MVTKGYGVTITEIEESCPADLEPYVNAYKLEEKKIDEHNWILGKYVETATLVAVEHNMHGRKAKSKYYEKPFLEMVEEENKVYTNDEKKLQVQQFFMQLEIMQANFEIEKGIKGNKG